MKKIIVLALLCSNLVFSNLAFGDQETEMPDVEFVRDTYEYCLTAQNSEVVDNKELLNCVNSEMEYYEYTPFASVEKIIEFIGPISED